MRRTTGSIQAVRSTSGDDVIYTTYENIGEENAYGLSIFSNISFQEKFNLNAGIDSYYVDMDNNINDPIFRASNSGFVVNGRFFGSYKITGKWRIQAFTFFRGRRVSLQGSNSGFYMYSLNLNRSFNDDRGSIGIGSDNFFTPEFEMNNEVSSPFITQNMTTTRKFTNFKINFSYKFGKMEIGRPPRRRKSVRNDDLMQEESNNQQMGDQ